MGFIDLGNVFVYGYEENSIGKVLLLCRVAC